MATSAVSQAVLLLERLASETWHRLKVANTHGFSIGEETITDLNLLEIIKASNPGFRVRQVAKREESRIGADWMWWVGSGRCGWIQYGVQAKKLDLSSGSYRAFRQPKGQLAALEAFTSRVNAIPLYCFYNGNVAKPAGLACGEGRSDQYGCTVVAFDRVRNVYLGRGKARFSDLHQGADAHPWRCLAADHCYWLTTETGKLRNPLIPAAYHAEQVERIRVQSLPAYIESFMAGELGDLPADLYPEKSDRPRYILVMDIDARERELL